MAHNDEILSKYIEKLEEENKELKYKLEKRPKPVLGVHKMWSSFCENDSLHFLVGFLGFFFIIAGSILAYNLLTPIDKPIDKFHINAYTTREGNNCYKVMQEISDGSMEDISTCLADENKAIKYLEKVKEQY